MHNCLEGLPWLNDLREKESRADKIRSLEERIRKTKERLLQYEQELTQLKEEDS